MVLEYPALLLSEDRLWLGAMAAIAAVGHPRTAGRADDALTEADGVGSGGYMVEEAHLGTKEVTQARHYDTSKSRTATTYQV